MKNPLKKRLKSLQKAEVYVFRTHASIYDGAFP